MTANAQNLPYAQKVMTITLIWQPTSSSLLEIDLLPLIQNQSPEVYYYQ